MAEKKKKKTPAPKANPKKGFPAANEEELVAPEEMQAPAEKPDEIEEGPEAPEGGKPKAPKEDGPDDGEENPEEDAAEKTEEEADLEKEAEITELNNEIDTNFTLAWDAERPWMDAAKEDIEFKAGNQWSEEDRQALKAQRRPCLTFNKIKATVKLLTGHQIQNSARLQVVPEGGEDQKFSDVADKLLNHIDEQAKLEFNFSYLFAGGQTTGRGHIELEIDFDKDPIFGRLKSHYHGRPGTIVMDPRGSDYNLNEDREFGFKLVKRSKGELKGLYPKKSKEIDEEITMDTENPSLTADKEGDANNYGDDKRSTTIGINKVSDVATDPEIMQFHVKEYWRYKRVPKFYAYFVVDGGMPEFDTAEERDAEIEKRKAEYLAGGGLEQQWAVVSRERTRKEMHVAIRCGGVILEDGLSPLEPHYTGYPWVQFIADWTPEAEKLEDAIQGIVRCAKDAQREKNKARSQFLHIINTAANSGWIVDHDALDDHKIEELKTFGSTPGIVIKKKANSTVQRIDPTPAPVAQSVREKAADDSFKEVTGINADLLAVDESSNPSGKAIALRIRQAITILEPDFMNLRYTKKLIGTTIMQMVPMLFDLPKIKKVLGEQFLKDNEIDDTFLKTFLITIEDLRYNVRIAEQGDTKTMREETFEDLMQMLSHGTPIPFEVLAEFMSLPNKAEVIKKVGAYQQQQAALQMAAAGPKGGGAPGGPGAPPVA